MNRIPWQYECQAATGIPGAAVRALGPPEYGIAQGTRLEDLPGDWVCPTCGTPKGVCSLLDE